MKKIQRGDVIAHNSKAHIRSLSRVQADPEPRTSAVHDGPGDVADVEYFDLDDPVYFRDFAAEVYDLNIPDGPIQQNHDGSFGVGEGYCFAFSHEALRCVRERASTWPSWQELRHEARYPSTTQEASDIGEEAQTAIRKEHSGPERTEQTVARIIRDSRLARQVKEQAGYQCQICGEPPIELPDGSVYAEAHHIKPLSKGGPDVEKNIVCVCPSCHAKLDYGTIPLIHEEIEDGAGSPVGARFVEYHNRQVAGRN